MNKRSGAFKHPPQPKQRNKNEAQSRSGYQRSPLGESTVFSVRQVMSLAFFMPSVLISAAFSLSRCRFTAVVLYLQKKLLFYLTHAISPKVAKMFFILCKLNLYYKKNLNREFDSGSFWRREGDSNPRYAFTYARFPSVCLKPLNHLSNFAA